MEGERETGRDRMMGVRGGGDGDIEVAMNGVYMEG